jgi:hypothetical protein
MLSFAVMTATALSRQGLAALGAAGSQYFAATDGCHTGAEAMAAFADELARLISAFHFALRFL